MSKTTKDVEYIVKRQTKEWVERYVDLMRSRKRAAAFKMLLEAMTPSDIVADQLAAHPLLLKIAQAAYQAKKERDAMADQVYNSIIDLALKALLSSLL